MLLNPGAANHGDAKLWPADRFAALADALTERRNALVLLNGSPAERPILDAVHAAARHEPVDLPRLGADLATLPAVCGRCALAVTGDTGARHVAAAMGAPTLSLFGPTDPRWTELDAPHEHLLRSTTGRMSDLPTDRVIEQAERMLG